MTDFRYMEFETKIHDINYLTMRTKSKEYFESELENILNIHFDAKYYFEDVKYEN